MWALEWKGRAFMEKVSLNFIRLLRVVITPSVRGENDSKQSDEFQARKKWTPDVFVDFRRPYWWTKNCPPLWRLHTKLCKGVWNVSANNSETVGHKDLRFGQIVYILVFYNIHFLDFFHWTVFNLFFWAVFIILRDSENEEYRVPAQN